MVELSQALIRISLGSPSSSDEITPMTEPVFVGTQEPPADKRLKPQLRMFDAVATGLAAILGAGIFAVISPAAAIAGPSLLISLVLASFVAFCNALSSAQLAVAFPFTGGTYGFGRRMLGDWWGYSAGWMFIVANTVGPGVIALAFGAYLNASFPAIPARAAAITAALVMTGLNATGIKRSVRVTDVVVVFSILCLLAVVLVGASRMSASNLSPFAPGGVVGVLRATGLLFFAYTGYSRIATLVEEVHDPPKIIPRATVVALGTSTLLYLGVGVAALGVLGASGVAGSSSPLEKTMIVAGSALGAGVVAAGALLTTFNEGLSDLLGVSRVAFAMARQGDLPTGLATMGAQKNPWRSVLLVGFVAMLVAAFAPFGTAVAISSFGTLLYYSVTNLSALKLPKQQRAFPIALAVAGLVGCLGLAFSLAPQDVALGLGVLAAGLLYRQLKGAMHRG
jgi:basic amino acid/polyamine antiporter, APA family